MWVRCSLSLALLLSLSLQTGCAMFDSKPFSVFKPAPSNGRGWNADEDDPYGYVGDLGRGDAPREKDPDSWWGKYIMHPRSRNIEKSLGIDY